MLFAPPEVKSLSKYSEFGSHLRNRDFLFMVGLAIVFHIIIVVIYSMEPYEPAMIIPVRVLNIKLNGGGTGIDDLPPPSAMPGYQGAPGEKVNEERTEFRHEKSEQSKAADKAFSGAKQKPLIEILSQDNEKRKHRHDEILAKERNFEKPKKYVRDSQLTSLDLGKEGGNGSGMAGVAGGQEIVRNYEQEISLWMAQHKRYPEAARKRGLEGNAVVRIRIDRDGNIIYSTIDVSSGNSTIDQAVMTMVRDSNPVPHVPENYPQGNQLEFLIPVSFRLE